MKRVLLITGPPATGKTTVLMRTISIFLERGFKVGGMLSREVRENGVRTGFEIIDIESDKTGWLANVSQKTGPQVGKYRVNLKDLDDIGAKAISAAVVNCDIVAIDEIGPMELFSEKFRDAVEAALESNKFVVAVVHWKAEDKLVRDVKSREDAEIFGVTHENREILPLEIGAKNPRSDC